jgi:hypothetical protein
MWKVIRGECLKDHLLRSMNNYPNNYSQLKLRNYADEYKAIWYRENAVQPNGKPITQHEATHANILDVKNKTVVGIFTSAKKNKDPTGETFQKLSSTKYDGSFVPLKDANGKLITDINGCSVPNPNKGGQFVAPLSKVRHIIDSSIYTKDENYSKYCDTHEDKLKTIFANSTEKPKITRISNNDSQLYHENGQPIYNKDGEEIDY